MNRPLEVTGTQPPASELLNAFSGFAVLGLLVTVLVASALVTSSGGAQTPHSRSPPPDGFQDPPLVPSVTFYFLDSEAQLEEMSETIAMAQAEIAQIPLPSYPRVETMVAHTPDEEALAYASVVSELHSSKGELCCSDSKDVIVSQQAAALEEKISCD